MKRKNNKLTNMKPEDVKHPVIMIDSRDMEITRVKGEIEAVKHYYAVLIAKNVSKVESALGWADEKIEVLDYSIKGVREEINLLEDKVRRIKVVKKKTPIIKQLELVYRLFHQLEGDRDVLLKIRHELKQVL